MTPASLTSTGPSVLTRSLASQSSTDTSLLPMAAHAAGLEFEDLVERIVELALEQGGIVRSSRT